MGQGFSRWQQRRSAKTLKELAPRRTPGHEAPIPKLTRDMLLSALSHVASFIKKKGGDVTVVAVGGAMTAQDVALLVQGARDAAKREKNLEGDWFNNRTILFMPNEQKATLTDQAFAQREIIFREPGLTVLAAPWNYSFCCKVDRISGGGIHGAREYDLDDACHYLRRFLQLNKVAQVKQATVYAWFEKYELVWSEHVRKTLTQVNLNCRKKFEFSYDVIVA
ncbi:hypothetical protein F5Y16DRAFT_416870 [Xylariaceae sp. FL0255]|nr:hypothetical protein F5Y16DRAFT_416870 [Xylariaceae sp. FL0255]